MSRRVKSDIARSTLRRNTLSVAILAAMGSPAAMTQEGGQNFLEEVVVSASYTGRPATIMDSTVSVSVLDDEEISNNSPRSTPEILKNIPGLRVESSSGEGNTNVAARGLPNPTGGWRYGLFLVDGLPTEMFGDMNFLGQGTLFRHDAGVKRVESIRGGAAGTLMTNTPGGFVNFVHKNGEDEEGTLILTTGIGDYDTNRVDFAYGGALSDTVDFQVSGFHRIGEGARDVGYKAEEGGQYRVSLTKKFDEGIARVSYRKQDDHTIPLFPSAIGPNGKELRAGFDTDDVAASKHLIQNRYINANRDLGVTDIRDGIHPLVESFGVEIEYDLGDGWTVSNKFRTTDVTGGFVGNFFAGFYDDPAAVAGNFAYLGSGVGFQYANGPNAGQAYNGAVQDIKVFDVTFNDMGNTFNDLRLSKDLTDEITLVVGYFTGRQSFDQEWHWSNYIAEARGSDEALIDIVDAGGDVITEAGLVAYGSNWGGCCTKHEDLDFTESAPYVALNMRFDDLTIDLGIRQEMGEASGIQYSGVTGVNVGDINNDGRITPVEQNAVITDRNNPTSFVDWDYSETGFNLGANYAFNDEMAVFGGVSRGYRFAGDRKSGSTDASGELTDEAVADEVTQYELGYKWSGDNMALFATAFAALSKVATNDFTKLPADPNINAEYEITGVEFEMDWDITDSFSLSGSLTLTDSEITKGANKGNTPQRQADYIYNLTAAYTKEDYSVGLNVVGTDDSYAGDDNTIVMDGYTTANAFVNYSLTEKLEFSLNVNNLTDEVGVTELGGGPFARVINPRTASVSAKFNF